MADGLPPNANDNEHWQKRELAGRDADAVLQTPQPPPAGRVWGTIGPMVAPYLQSQRQQRDSFVCNYSIRAHGAYAHACPSTDLMRKHSNEGGAAAQ